MLTKDVPSWKGYLKVLADFSGSEVDNFAMSRDSRAFAGKAVDIDRVVATFAEKSAAVALHVPDEITPLHLAGRSRVSRMTSLPASSSSASIRLVSRIS